MAITLAAAWRWGAAPERTTATILLVAAIATVLVRNPHNIRYVHVEARVAIVDVALLLMLVWIALIADRHWPLGAAALQLFTIVGHLGKYLDETLWQGGYALLTTIPSFLICLLVILGTARHRSRQRHDGVDNSWLRSWRRSGLM